MEFAEPGTSMRIWNREAYSSSPLNPSGAQTSHQNMVHGYALNPCSTEPAAISTQLNQLETGMYRRATVTNPNDNIASLGLRVHREVWKNNGAELIFSQDAIINTSCAQNEFFNRGQDFPYNTENIYYCWYLPWTPQATAQDVYTWTNPIGEENSPPNDDDHPCVSTKCQGDTSYTKGDNSSRTTTMGEVVTSLRCLTRRFTFTSDLSNLNPTPISLNFMSAGELNSRQSVFEIISWLYRFTTGGIRAKIIGQEDIVLATTVASLDSNKDVLANLTESNAASHIQDFKLNPIMELQLPYYSPAELLAVGSNTFRDNNYGNLSQLTVKPINGKRVYNYKLLLAASDDQNFTFLVGPPAFFVGPPVA
jgi:hypothetical protein